MDGYLNWFFAFITSMFSGIWNGIASFFKGIIYIFDFGTYFGLFSKYQADFGVVGWIFSILSFILVYAFWISLIFIIVLLLRKYLRFRQSLIGNEDLLEEIADLHRDVVRLTKEKEKIIGLKCSTNLQGLEAQFANAENEFYAQNEDGTVNNINNNNYQNALSPANSNEDAKVMNQDPRFFRLAAVDEKYATFAPLPFQDDVNLKELCENLRNYACSQASLYYEPKIIRLMIAGLASTKMVVLQGISGTGKTSLPYVMGKFFENNATIASVQPSWRDRSELFGFFNEFTKKFNETEVLRRIYEASFTDDINLIVLDEMNIARVEYYFAEMLSILEMPDPEEWKIQLLSSVWDNDPCHLEDGKLQIPQNIWYIGTANNDDSTFSVSDKVYDRAFIINLDSKGIPFQAPLTDPKRISYSYLQSLFDKAIADYPVSQDILDKITKMDNYVIEHFRVAFGNRIMKQLKMFVPVYVACGGDDLEAVDYMLATKVFRKFESLNLSLIRDEIKGLINFLDVTFGKDKMQECIVFLRRLQKSF